MHHAVPRRAVLAVSAAASGLALSGCGSGSGGGHRGPTADERIRRRSTAAGGELLDRYDATLRRHPETAAAVRPLRGEVARQIAAFGGGMGGTTASPSASTPGRSGASAPHAAASEPSGTPSGPSRGRSAVPADRQEALGALSHAARSASDARIADLDSASPHLAALLASVAASWAGHAALLGGGA